MRFARLTSPLRLLSRRLLSDLPEHKEIIMPKVSPTMTEGRLVAWKLKEGDAFAEGDDIADIESDKATMPISAREDGFMARILVKDDSPDIPLGQVLAVTVEEEEFIAAFKDYQLPSAQSPQANASPNIAPQAADPAPPIASVDAPASQPYNGPLGPAIMRLLNEYPNLNLDTITPTGPKGRLLKGDVLAAIDDGSAFAATTAAAASPSAAASSAVPSTASATETPTTESQQPDAPPAVDDFTDIPVSSMRRAIAKRLQQSKTSVPHRYASIRYELDALLALRKRVNAADPSPRVSVNDFVIKAVATALHRVPAMNVQWEAQRAETVANDRVDISMAVAVEGGLITPIVPDADRKGLAEIAGTTKQLVQKAKEGTLAPEEFEGGSFSISNLGMFGISQFSAIINPPQSGILAVGAGFKRVIPDENGEGKVITEGIATISTDSRAIEEETAAEFLKEFSSCMSNPESMLM